MAENVTSERDRPYWLGAQRAVKAIASQIEGAFHAAPEDAVGCAERTQQVAREILELRKALCLDPTSDQRQEVKDLVLAPDWEAVPAKVRQQLQADVVEANRVIGEVRAALAGAVPDIGAPVEECVRTLVAQHRAAVFSADPQPSTANARLQEIRAALSAEFPGTEDPLVAVRALLKERKEMLAEMARAPDAEDVIAGAAEVQDDHPSAPEMPPPEMPPPEIAAVQLEGAIAAALASLVAVISVSMTDWTRSSELAWIYGVLVGWAPDDIEELRIRFGWGVATSQTIEEHRAAVCAAATSP